MRAPVFKLGLITSLCRILRPVVASSDVLSKQVFCLKKYIYNISLIQKMISVTERQYLLKNIQKEVVNIYLYFMNIFTDF